MREQPYMISFHSDLKQGIVDNSTTDESEQLFQVYVLCTQSK